MRGVYQGPRQECNQEHLRKLGPVIKKLQKNYSFFAELEEREVHELLASCRGITCEKGRVLFKEGDIGDRFFLVLSGEIVISKSSRELARMTPGHIFGEVALLEHIPRTATAAAVEDTELFEIPADIVSLVMPGLALKISLHIARQMSEKLREANNQAETSS
jgi:CRP-like cAMP-binding protein